MEATAQKSSPNGVPAELYRYSSWVHVGPGAQDCGDVDEQSGENSCGDPLHFHAWCRLPNQFQHREIRDKALAAKARRMRQLRDPDSDAYAVLEEELAALDRIGEPIRSEIVDELLQRDWWGDYTEAGKDIRDETDDDGKLIYEHLEADQARYLELQSQDEQERPKDEFAELEKHLTAYNDKVDKRRAAIEKPKRKALDARDLDDLIAMLRDQRIDLAGTDELMHHYSIQEWLAGTLRYPHGPVVFPDVQVLHDAAQEVIAALKGTYDDLERTQQEGGEGKGF